MASACLSAHAEVALFYSKGSLTVLWEHITAAPATAPDNAAVCTKALRVVLVISIMACIPSRRTKAEKTPSLIGANRPHHAPQWDALTGTTVSGNQLLFIVASR